jgi:hypothetical protein
MKHGLPLKERISLRVAPCADAACGCECLLWDGATDRKGYGRIKVAGRLEAVHRMAWQSEVRPIPDGLTIDHVKARGCVHKNCVKVAHLEPVTSRVNTLRGSSFAAVNAAKTHCGTCGEPYDLFNTYWRRDGSRECRKCIRAANRRRQATHFACPTP